MLILFYLVRGIKIYTVSYSSKGTLDYCYWQNRFRKYCFQWLFGLVNTGIISLRTRLGNAGLINLKESVLSLRTRHKIQKKFHTTISFQYSILEKSET